MKNKISNKGFTLIEILAVVVIIGILVAIAVPIISRYINQGKEKYYRSLEDELVIIARDYYTKNKSELPRGQYDANGVPMYINQVSLSTLIDRGYVTNDIVDADKNPCTGYVRVENKSKGEYEYISCIKCGDKYTSEKNNAYCTLYENFDSDDYGTSNGALLCNIDTGSYSNDTWTNQDVTATVTSSYENGVEAQIGMYKNASTGTIIKAINNQATITLTDSNNLKMYTYDKYGNRGECTIDGIKIDKENPSVTFTSSNITTSDSGIKVTATLKDNNGVVAYQVNKSSDSPTDGWTTINEMKETTITTDYLTTTDSTMYYIWVKDVAGNINKKRIIVGLSGWSGWTDNGHNFCATGTLYSQRTTYSSATYGKWGLYTSTWCNTSSDTCESKTGDAIYAVSIESTNGVCPSGYTRYSSTECKNRLSYATSTYWCFKDEYYAIEDLPSGYTYYRDRANDLRIEAGVDCMYFDGVNGPFTKYRTRTKTWSSYTETACDWTNTNICLWRYECRTRSYTYSLD